MSCMSNVTSLSITYVISTPLQFPLNPPVSIEHLVNITSFLGSSKVSGEKRCTGDWEIMRLWAIPVNKGTNRIYNCIRFYICLEDNLWSRLLAYCIRTLEGQFQVCPSLIAGLDCPLEHGTGTH